MARVLQAALGVAASPPRVVDGAEVALRLDQPVADGESTWPHPHQGVVALPPPPWEVGTSPSPRRRPGRSCGRGAGRIPESYME